MAGNRLAWNASAKQFYRELGKQANGRPRRFYLGHDKEKAIVKVQRLTTLWAAHESRWEKYSEAGLDDSPFPQWEPVSLAIAEAILDEKWSVTIPIPDGYDGGDTYHWLVGVRTSYPIISIEIESPEIVEREEARVKNDIQQEVDEEIERHKKKLRKIRRIHSGYIEGIRTGQNLFDALGAYIDYLKSKHVDLDGVTNQSGLKQADRIKRLKNFAEDTDLGLFKTTQIESIIETWRVRPVTPQGKRYSPVTCQHTLTAFRAFVNWLHREQRFPWRKPEDFDWPRTSILKSQEEKHASVYQKTFSKEQIGVLWQHATFFQRKLILLALNCGFLRSEIGSLQWSHINGNRIKTLRPKTGVPGQFLLWELTLRYLGPRTAGLVVVNRNGRSMVSKTEGNNISSLIPNSWNRLIERVQKSHPDFERLPFKYLRKTASQFIREVSDGETARVFLQHRNPVPSDVELGSYTNPIFTRVFEAQEKVWNLLKDVLVDTEPVDLPRKLSNREVLEIRRLKRSGTKTKWLSRKYQVSEDTIRRIGRKK